MCCSNDYSYYYVHRYVYWIDYIEDRKTDYYGCKDHYLDYHLRALDLSIQVKVMVIKDALSYSIDVNYNFSTNRFRDICSRSLAIKGNRSYVNVLEKMKVVLEN